MKKIILIIALISLPCLAKDLPNIQIPDEEMNTTLKGYAEYLEDSEAIYLKDNENKFVLNIKIPQKIESKSLLEKQITPSQNFDYSKYNSEEYRVRPTNRSKSISRQAFSVGAKYDNDVDYAQFEQTAGLYTKYEKEWFSISTSYEKTIGSTNGVPVDTIYISPEFKLGQRVSIKPVLSSNLTYRRKKAELILSINPFLKSDRFNFELGTAQTFDENNVLIKNQFKFNTRFKL